MNENPTQAPEAQYAVVEIFGHRRHVGRVTEEEKYGTKMLRVDVPTEAAAEAGDFEIGYTTHLYGGSAIFGVTPTTLEAVWSANRGWRRPGLLPPPDLAAPDDDRPF